MHIDFPYQFDARGRTAETTYADHIRDMVEQVLFTSPNERVNRPDFGCGILDLVQEPAGAEMQASLDLIIKTQLHRWLGDVIEPMEVRVNVTDSTILAIVKYKIRPAVEPIEQEFEFRR